MSNKNLLESFAHALDGLWHVMWTQRHVRIQLFMVILVLVLCYQLRVPAPQMLFVLSAITLVLVAELFNTAIEVVVNLVTETFHPLAKIAKDVAAAGVLIASFYAVMVGGGVFLDRGQIHALIRGAHVLNISTGPNPVVVLLLGFLVLSIIVALGKIRAGHGSLLRGGAISAHSAIAFLLSSSIAVQSHFNPAVTSFAFLLAILVAQSRVEGKIHTLSEVIWGATLALAFMTLLMLLPVTH